MRRAIGIGTTLLLACLALGCPSVPQPSRRNIVVIGARGMKPLLTEISQRYYQRRPDVRVDLQAALGDRAVADTRQGLADIGMLGRSLRAEETGVVGHPLARDGVAFVVHRTNNVPLIHETHLVGVLTRVYTTWKDIGGSDRPIFVVGLGDGRAVRDVLLEYFALRPQQVRPDPSLATSQQVLQAVAVQPAAIGYCSLGAAELFSRKNNSVRLLPLQGVPATLDNVRNRTYPLLRPLLLLAREHPSADVKEFLDFACSEEVHDLIQQHGYIPGSP
ncbi:MAG: substrate-binding domain-containing protein [Gemmataceae bacterium]